MFVRSCVNKLKITHSLKSITKHLDADKTPKRITSSRVNQNKNLRQSLVSTHTWKWYERRRVSRGRLSASVGRDSGRARAGSVRDFGAYQTLRKIFSGFALIVLLLHHTALSQDRTKIFGTCPRLAFFARISFFLDFSPLFFFFALAPRELDRMRLKMLFVRNNVAKKFFYREID